MTKTRIRSVEDDKLEALHKRFVVLTICQIYYISRLLTENGLSNSISKIYSKAAYPIKEIIQANINYCKKFDLNITELDKLLPILYWLLKIHKTPIGARFL